MLIYLFLILNKAKADISNELLVALDNLRSGNLDVTKDFFKKNLPEHKSKPLFRKRYIEYLMKIGDYESIIREYSDVDDENVHLARKYIGILNSKDIKKIVELNSSSEFNIDVIRYSIKYYLLNNDLKMAEEFVKRGLRLYENDIQIKKLSAQFNLISCNFIIGIEALREVGMKKEADNFQGFLEKYENIDKVGGSKLRNLKLLYNSINEMTLEDIFSPSIYTGLKFLVLRDFVSLAVTNKEKKISSLASILYKKRNDEESKYFYIMSLIYDNNIRLAEKIYKETSFSHKIYGAKIKKALDDIERNREKKRSENEQQGYHHGGKTSKAGKDFLKYYEVLGVSKDSKEKDIKKAYAKIISKNSKRKMNEKQKAEWEEKHLKLNKAIQVLGDKKKREMYDNGIDPDSPQSQYSRQGHRQQNFQGFHGFDDFNAFDFFSAFDMNGGGFRRGGRRTQFVFF